MKVLAYQPPHPLFNWLEKIAAVFENIPILKKNDDFQSKEMKHCVGSILSKIQLKTEKNDFFWKF